MYQQLETHFERKKPVPGRYNPNTNRIFDDEVSNESSPFHRTKQKIVLKKTKQSEDRNRPHPQHSAFLLQNCRTLHQPIYMIKDDVADGNWWPQGDDHYRKLKPKFSTNTTQRSSFSTISIENVGNRPRGRHGSNPHVTPSTGIIPVNNGRIETKNTAFYNHMDQILKEKKQSNVEDGINRIECDAANRIW